MRITSHIKVGNIDTQEWKNMIFHIQFPRIQYICKASSPCFPNIYL
jgi:hypothetical protein